MYRISGSCSAASRRQETVSVIVGMECVGRSGKLTR